MGHNRSGVRRKIRLRRRKRFEERLAERAARAGEGGAHAAETRPPAGAPQTEGAPPAVHP
jgi:hypothetical protein